MQYEIKQIKFDNGVTLFYFYTPSDDISIIANVNAGSLYEARANSGISHLVEHMIFKGTSRRFSRDSIYNEISLLGDKLFCHTRHENIPLGMRVVLDDFDSALDLISDLLYNGKMDPDEIQKEKKIVLSEIRYRKDDPYIYLWDQFNETLFDGCSLAQPIIGYQDIVKALKPEDVANFYRDMFTPANTTIFVVGSIPYEEVEGKIYEYFGKKSNGSEEHRILPIEIPRNVKRIINLQKELDNIHVMIGRIVPPASHEDSYPLIVLASVLYRSVSDRILNQEPISYDRNVDYINNRFAGLMIAYATAKFKDFDRVKELIFEEFAKYAKGNIPEAYIEDSKMGKKKNFILKNSTTMDRARMALNFWLLGEVNGINRHLDQIESITVEQVRGVAKKYVKLDDLLSISLGNFDKDKKPA